MAYDLEIFNPQLPVTEFGNKFVAAILQHDMRMEAAETEIQEGKGREILIDTELTRVAMHLHQSGAIDLMRIYGTNADSSALYRNMLVEMGIKKRTVTEDDRIVYTFNDPVIAQAYEFKVEDTKEPGEGETDSPERKEKRAKAIKARARTNALNIRLTRAIKAAIALIDAGASIDNLTYRETQNGREPVITKGPQEIVGTVGEAVLKSTNVAKVAGASSPATLGSLAKIADNSHKEKQASKDDAEKGTRKDGEGGKSLPDDFLALANAMLMAVKTKEKTFSDAEKAVLRNLVDEIKTALK